MGMKKIYILLSLLFLTVSFSSCDMIKESRDAEKVEVITVTFKINPVTGWVDYNGNGTPDTGFDVSGLEVTFSNSAEDSRMSTFADENGYATIDLVKGYYNVTVASSVEHEGKTYYMNGVIKGISLIESNTRENASTDPFYMINIRPALVGPLCFKEIYYAGSPGNYFRDQFYEIYNNGDEVYYLDHLVFGRLYPEYATDVKPNWPEEDGSENFIYAVTLWQFPGNEAGDMYPLAPGESIVIAQEAADHTKNFTFAGIPGMLDTRSADFETWTGNNDRVNLAVPDMVCVWNTGTLNSMQWLTGVGGSGLFLYEPGRQLKRNDPEYWIKDETFQVEVGKTAQYARIPVEKVIDGIECIPFISQLDRKRMAGFLDAGAISTDGTYLGISNARKVIGERPDGTPILQDTNNSLEDFENMDPPVLRRYNVKRPSWSVNQ